MQEQLVGHVSRDATAIEGREKPTPKPKPKQQAKPNRKRGRPRKGEERPKEPSRLQRQELMTLAEMLDDLPHACDVGTKRNAKGHQDHRIDQVDQRINQFRAEVAARSDDHDRRLDYILW